MKQKRKQGPIYCYPAIFTPEPEGGYFVHFPDIEGCFTCGDTISEGLMMAADALALMVYTVYEEQGIDAPEATLLDAVHVEPGEFVSYVACNTLEYRKKFGAKAVKKTLTIPGWLNDAATEKHINFSKVLQKALQQEIAES